MRIFTKRGLSVVLNDKIKNDEMESDDRNIRLAKKENITHNSENDMRRNYLEHAER
jgi:hypothetical protein